ncbi:MAG: hypothetical protein RJA31_130 [Actinomycetota bacterium]
MKFIRTIGVTAIAAITIAGFAVSGAEAASKRGANTLPAFGDFVAAHGTAAIRQANPGISATEIESLSNDSTARVNSFGKILFVEGRIDPATVAPLGITANVTTIPLESFLSLNSRTESSKTIFLDFDGHTVPAGTIWDYPEDWGFGGSPLVAGDYPAFTMDGSATFNSTEKQAIINAWAAVAEDYAMFDVNVTTQDPGQAAIERTGTADANFGTRALVTPGNSEFSPVTCDCGGIAYTSVFDESLDTYTGINYGIGHDEWQPAFVFVTPSQVSGDSAAQVGKFVSDIATHEVGHNLSLVHDGSFGDADHDEFFVDNNLDGYDDVTGEVRTEYLDGYKDGKNWAPIMGAGYYNGVVQWSNGDYETYDEQATNPGDDFDGIASTGLSLLADENFNSSSTAPLLSYTARDGVIGSRTDVDWYKVQVTAGNIGIYSYAPTPDTNLDTKLTLLDWSGLAIFSTDALSDASEIVSSNPALDGVGKYPVAGMDGILNATLPNGTYYIKIEGVGRTGSYSDYGSVGQYSIKVRNVSVGAIPTAGYPYITGTARRGRTLTVNRGTWTSGTALTQQWLRDGTPIAGATGRTYVLKSADVGHRIAVRVLGQLSGKRPVLRQSARTSSVTN